MSRNINLSKLTRQSKKVPIAFNQNFSSNFFALKFQSNESGSFTIFVKKTEKLLPKGVLNEWIKETHFQRSNFLETC